MEISQDEDKGVYNIGAKRDANKEFWGYQIQEFDSKTYAN